MIKALKFIYRQFKKAYAKEQYLAQLQSRFPELRLEPQVQIKGDLKNFTLSGELTIQQNSVIHLGGMPWCEYQGRLEIGAGGCISPACVIYAAGPGGITIGENFDCGPGVKIFASRSGFRKGEDEHVFAPVTIGDHVIVFANAVISPGVTIGDYAVIMAGAVVTRDVPAHSLAGGVPANVIESGIRTEESPTPA